MSNAKTREVIHAKLYGMQPDAIKHAALKLLVLMDMRCSVKLMAEITGISRTTLYKWFDADVPLEAMSVRDCAWFILVCETDPKLMRLLSREPATHKNLVRQGMAQEDAAA
jgi:hypothetical protein